MKEFLMRSLQETLSGEWRQE